MENNGYAIEAQEGEIEKFALTIATEKLEIPEIARWLEKHSKKK